jgi:hypothetical protein
MLPEPQNGPSPVPQFRVGPPVPENIAVELLRPPFLVGPRPRRVIGTTVPEAPVDEHRKALPSPNDVGLAPETDFWPDIYAIADSARVK